MFPPRMLQHEAEFAAFIDVIHELDVQSYLEIGSKFGGSLWRIGMAMPKGSACVFIDLPRREGASSYYSMHGVIRRLSGEGRSCTAIWGDSTSLGVIAQARQKGPYDLVFIDCNHTYDFVRRDWVNYRPMASKAIAFHDVALQSSGVPRLWDEIRADGRYRYHEIKLDPAGTENGIGIVFL